MQTRTILSTQYMQNAAPSIFAKKPHDSRSNRYSFVSTIDMIETLKKKDWHPVQVVESKVHGDCSRRGFQKHLVRFAQLSDIENDLVDVGSTNFEILLRNSMDGTTRFQLDLGVYRLVCGNGMVISDSQFNFGRFKHQGLEDQDIIDVTNKVVESAPKIKETMEKWQSIEMTDKQRESFAYSALVARYGDKDHPVRASQLLAPRRWADNKTDLWHTFNTVQEHLLKGGLRQYQGDMLDQNRKKRASVRAVKSVDGDVTLNKALWQLSADFATVSNN